MIEKINEYKTKYDESQDKSDEDQQQIKMTIL